MCESEDVGDFEALVADRLCKMRVWSKKKARDEAPKTRQSAGW